MDWKLQLIRDHHFLGPLYDESIANRTRQFANFKNEIHQIDSGFDLFIPSCLESNDSNWHIPGNSTCFIPLGIKLVRYSNESTGESRPFYIYPRSSIWKKPVRLSNNTGIIDAGYRGELGIALDNIRSEPFVVERGWRLVQACSPGLMPFIVSYTDTLNNTVRGEGGFGSTGQ